jgi:hypothetical protein
MRTAIVCAAALMVAGLAPPASAGRAASTGITVRYPSGEVPDAGALAAALADPSVGTVVFERGTNPFSAPVTVFRRSGLTLRGATSRASDSVIESSSAVAVLLDECTGVTIRDLTIRSTATSGEAIRLQSVRSSSVEGFVRDITVAGCRLEGFVPLRGTVRARGLSVSDSQLDVTRSGGAGILWEDGPSLLVTRNRFTCSAPDFASAAILVRGALVSDSEGDRARGVIVTRNRVSGDFATAIDLADVVDTRVLRNQVEFPEATYTGGGGRAGIVVRRQAASAATEDYSIRSNRVRGAHTGVWLLNASTGIVASNDLRRNGTPAADTRFNDTGCALRIAVFGVTCPATVTGNDFRDLRSPVSAPAVVVTPTGAGDACFDEGQNRVDAGRDVY